VDDLRRERRLLSTPPPPRFAWFPAPALCVQGRKRKLPRGLRRRRVVGRLVGDAGLGEGRHAGAAGERRARDQHRQGGAGDFAKPNVRSASGTQPSASSSMRWPVSAET